MLSNRPVIAATVAGADVARELLLSLLSPAARPRTSLKSLSSSRSDAPDIELKFSLAAGLLGRTASPSPSVLAAADPRERRACRNMSAAA